MTWPLSPYGPGHLIDTFGRRALKNLNQYGPYHSLHSSLPFPLWPYRPPTLRFFVPPSQSHGQLHSWLLPLCSLADGNASLWEDQLRTTYPSYLLDGGLHHNEPLHYDPFTLCNMYRWHTQPDRHTTTSTSFVQNTEQYRAHSSQNDLQIFPVKSSAEQTDVIVHSSSGSGSPLPILCQQLSLPKSTIEFSQDSHIVASSHSTAYGLSYSQMRFLLSTYQLTTCTLFSNCLDWLTQLTSITNTSGVFLHNSHWYAYFQENTIIRILISNNNDPLLPLLSSLVQALPCFHTLSFLPCTSHTLWTMRTHIDQRFAISTSDAGYSTTHGTTDWLYILLVSNGRDLRTALHLRTILGEDWQAFYVWSHRLHGNRGGIRFKY